MQNRSPDKSLGNQDIALLLILAVAILGDEKVALGKILQDNLCNAEHFISLIGNLCQYL